MSVPRAGRATSNVNENRSRLDWLGLLLWHFSECHKRTKQCLLLGEKRTKAGRYLTSAFDPDATFRRLSIPRYLLLSVAQSVGKPV
jgi:hypothetical protein